MAEAAGSRFRRLLEGRRELTISTRGRRSGKTHSLPVWFVLEGDTVHLLPVSGSDTNWYRNILSTAEITLTVDGQSLSVEPRPITQASLVEQTVARFRAKYGAGEIDRWYSKLDVAVEIPLPI
jgi:deazaflavin-dependent oxidoreductase (nitroreductase family)